MADTSYEATETWEYLENHVRPLLAKASMEVEIASHDWAYADLYKSGMLLIPAYTLNGKLQTFCSNEWKKYVVQRYLKSQGFGPKNPVTTWLGISIEEKKRAKSSDTKWQQLDYPLLFKYPLTRNECRQIVLDAGFPEPPKSSCWKCPHRRDSQWKRLKEDYPGDFEKACQMDERIRYEDILSGGSGLWLHESRRPLREVNFKTTIQVHPLFDQVSGCDSGQCWV